MWWAGTHLHRIYLEGVAILHPFDVTREHVMGQELHCGMSVDAPKDDSSLLLAPGNAVCSLGSSSRNGFPQAAAFTSCWQGEQLQNYGELWAALSFSGDRCSTRSSMRYDESTR